MRFFGSFSTPWSARLLAFAVWALVAGSAVFWVLQRPPRIAADGGTLDAGAASNAIDSQQVARALGAAGASAPSVATESLGGRLHLHGIVTHGARGAALVSVGDGPAKPVRVGQALPDLEGGWTLHAVAPHSIVFAAGEKEMELQMPPMTERSRAGDAVAPARPEVNAQSTLERQARQSLTDRVSRRLPQRAIASNRRVDGANRRQ